MDAIEARLQTITGLRVFEYPPDNVPVPAAFVQWPSVIDWDMVYGRGKDRYTIPVRVLVARTSERTARNRLGAFLDASGTSSVKAAIEGAGGNLGGTVDSVRVTQASNIGQFIVGDVAYWGADFTLDIIE